MALASTFDYFEKADGSVEASRPRALSNDLHKRFRRGEKNPPYIKSSVISTNGLFREKIIVFGEPISLVGGTNIENDIFSLFVTHENLSNVLGTLEFDYAAFAFSGYRQLKSEGVEAIYEPKDFNPLSQSLEFVKDYSQPNQISINQLIANNFSKKWIESQRSPEKSAKFARVLSTIEQAIFDITGWKIEFDLQTEPTNLVLKLNSEELDFDVLPDGLRSLISWMADLLGRVDSLKWADGLPINEKNLILFLDEIEVHLHPSWQRKVLPVVQKLFKNSQIFISTHSPFVINSVDDAWIYKLELENGKAHIAEVVKSEDGHSYSYVLNEIFDIREEFGIEVQKDLAKFKSLRNNILASNNGSEKSEKEILKIAKSLAVQSEELQTIIQFELRQINMRTGKSLAIEPVCNKSRNRFYFDDGLYNRFD